MEPHNVLMHSLTHSLTHALTTRQVRDSVGWWTRGFVYLDTVGVSNAHAGLIDVRRHDDTDGRTVLLVDNWRNVTGLQVGFRGRIYNVSSDTISVIEVQK
jgi:hypothetical protein